MRFHPVTGKQAYSTELPDGFDGHEGDDVILDENHLVADLPAAMVSLDLITGKTTELETLPDLSVDPLRPSVQYGELATQRAYAEGDSGYPLELNLCVLPIEFGPWCHGTTPVGDWIR